VSAYRFTRIVGFAAIVLGVLVLARDVIEVHSVPYGIAGVGLLAFGAWRVQAADRLRR
jgi:hypothetical protein